MRFGPYSMLGPYSVLGPYSMTKLSHAGFLCKIITKQCHVAVAISRSATIMAPKRRGRVASPEEDEGEDNAAPTQQLNEDVDLMEEDGEEPQGEGGDEDAAGSEDGEAPSRKRTRLSEDGAAAEVEPKNEPLPDIKPRITLPRDPADGCVLCIRLLARH